MNEKAPYPAMFVPGKYYRPVRRGLYIHTVMVGDRPEPGSYTMPTFAQDSRYFCRQVFMAHRGPRKRANYLRPVA